MHTIPQKASRLIAVLETADEEFQQIQDVLKLWSIGRSNENGDFRYYITGTGISRRYRTNFMYRRVDTLMPKHQNVGYPNLKQSDLDMCHQKSKNIVRLWPWNTRGVPVNAPRNLKEIQQCRTVWSSSPRQEPTNTTTWEYKIGHRKSGTIEDHVTTWSNGSNTVRLGQGVYPLLLLIDVPSPKMPRLKNISQKPMFFLALTHLHMFVYKNN